ncbi:MAG: folate-binding protein [Pseudomonadota bacterium]
MTRTVLELGGSDAEKFLSDLTTNVLPRDGGISYNALLSPQGKYLFDFFVLKQGDLFWLDVATARAQALGQRLMMYRLRADVTLKAAEFSVTRGLGDPPVGAVMDPRSSRMGWRAYGDTQGQDVDWDAMRVEFLIPESGVELIADESYILEMGFERLNGVDFKKGCYVGQEVTARMKHKTELRKGLARISISHEVPIGTELIADGKSVGKVFTQSKGRGLAYLRFDRAKGQMHAGDAGVALDLIA